MGLFSKKTIVCERCGKEYEARITLGFHVCNECLAKEKEKKDNVLGYIDYAQITFNREYTEEEMGEIAAHRDHIMEKYRQTEGMSREQLKEAADRYRKLTDEEIAEVVHTMARKTVWLANGAVYNRRFLALTGYDRVIVDMEDVFAVAYTSNYRLESQGSEVIFCVAFTNDPYVPVFPMIFLGKLGLLEVTKSKKGREWICTEFEDKCENLTYPVQDLKDLKKQLKQEDSVKGALTKEFMLEQISNASSGKSIFNVKRISDRIDLRTKKLLDDYGYIENEEMQKMMGMDGLLSGKFWREQITKIVKASLENITE